VDGRKIGTRQNDKVKLSIVRSFRHNWHLLHSENRAKEYLEGQSRKCMKT